MDRKTSHHLTHPDLITDNHRGLPFQLCQLKGVNLVVTQAYILIGPTPSSGNTHFQLLLFQSTSIVLHAVHEK